DALECHQSSHDIREVGRQAERILVDHFCEIICKFFEVDVPEFEIQVALEKSLDNRSDSFGINSRLQKVEIDDVLTETVHITPNDVEERVDHLGLELR